MGTLTCPFCNNELRLLDEDIYRCEQCDLTVDTSRFTARFGEHAPDYLSNTFDFMQECEEAQPKYCLSKVSMWQPGFDLSDVIMSGKANCVATVAKQDSIDYCDAVEDGYGIIAGRGIFVDSILYMFLQVLKGDVSYCGFGTRAFPTAEYQLYSKVVKYQNQAMPDEAQTIIINEFFAPNLESMVYWSKKMWWTKAHLPDLTPEQMMYSLVFCNPVKRIGIAGNVFFNIGSFIYRTLLALPDSIKLNNFDEQKAKLRELGYTEEKIAELVELCYKANPSTYVNESGFDVMYSACTDDLFLGFDTTSITEKDIKVVEAVYRRIASLTAKYASESKCLGLKFKEEMVVENQPTPDHTIWRFWCEVRDTIN